MLQPKSECDMKKSDLKSNTCSFGMLGKQRSAQKEENKKLT